ncbi:unnamed protein product [Brachionus calyciflorus]|uniref:ATP-dependent DNA helicase n=1 Tax=Brachionus calyciflorus TaxID=104777 RepID=A0A814ESR9_9BILA|nr:unnamed protein product [Brachionus calyciflorus]
MSKRQSDFKDSSEKKKLTTNTSRYDLTEDHFFDCMRQFISNTNVNNFERHVCSVCAEIKYSPLDNICSKPIQFFMNHKNILKYENLSQSFSTEFFKYDLAFSQLNNLVLEPNGFDFDNATLKICGSCEAYLAKNSTPKYALVNQLYLGQIPEELKDLTYSEQILISKSRMIGSIYKIKTNSNKSVGQNKIIGNIITFNQEINSISKILPNLDNLESLNVILIGKNIPNSIDFKKIFSVRIFKLITALKWLKRHNPEYEDITINYQCNIEVDPDNIPIILLKKLINLENDEDEPNIGETDPILLNSSGLINTNLNLLLNDKEKINKLNEIIRSKTNETILLYPHSEEPLNEYKNSKLLPQLYPVLFPYGFGGFNEQNRKTGITEREQTKHFLKLNCKRFVNNKTFIFYAFNLIQRHEFTKNLSIMTKKQYFNNISLILAKITEDEIKEEITNILQNGNIRNFKIQTLFSQSVMIAKNSQGSRFNLRHRRVEIKSYIISKGLPSFFITINPNDLTSPLIQFLNGSRISDDLIQKSINIANDPIHQSINFNILIQNLIDFLFGEKNENNLGLFGKLNGYYGIVEAQARGSLHIHFLIWIEDSIDPFNFEKFIENDSNKTKLFNYINSHIKCNLSDYNENWTEDQNKTDSDSTILSKTADYIFQKNFAKEFNKDVFMLAKETNIHHCTHSCYKTKAKTCRFGFGKSGKPKNLTTSFDKNNILNIKRDHCFLNNFNPYILASLRCNHDIKWIEKSQKDSLSSIYYITNYVTKNGVDVHNFLSFVSIFFSKYSKNHQFINETDEAKFILQKIFTICTSQTEYSAAQIAHMIFDKKRDGTYFSSDEISFIYYPKYLAYIDLQEKGLDPTIFESDDEIIDIKQKNSNKFDERLDYILRPKILDNVCLYSFYTEYKKVYNSSIIDNDIELTFLEKHPQKKCSILKHDKSVVPVLLGKNILDHPNEIMSKIMLVLFKPWRTQNDLKNENETYSNEFKSYLNNITENNPKIKKYIDNFNLLKKLKDDGVKDYNKNIFDKTIENNEIHIEPILDYDTDDYLDHEFCYNNNITTDIEIVTNNLKLEYSQNVGEINTIILTDNITEIKKIDDEQIKIYNVEYNNFQNSLVKNAMLISHKNVTITIEDIISIFKLNEKQAISIKLFLTNNQDQKLIYLGGSGGVGKSRVISAIEFFFHFNKKIETLKICAYTGSASTLINGNTIHSTFKFKVKSKDEDYQLLMNFDERQSWSLVEFLIIDEISMLSLNILADIDITLREIKNKNIIFGNINILFVGDLFQFPPVASFPLYKNITVPENLLIQNIINEKLKKNYNGRLLWLSLKDAIFLDVPMRQINDNCYAKFLMRVRESTVTTNDIILLKQKIINGFISKPFNQNIIVSKNSIKTHLINSIIRIMELEKNYIFLKAKSIDSI